MVLILAQTPPVRVDVVIVGAGLSGLRAAVDVHRAGLSVAVLEADARVGGKTLSVDASVPGHGKIDLGAAWINDSNQSEIYALACEFGFDLVKQRCEGTTLVEVAEGKIVMLPHGTEGDDPRLVTEAANAFVEQMNRDIDTLPALGDCPSSSSSSVQALDSMTFEAYAAKIGPQAIEVANQASIGFLGVQASEVSALYVLDYIQSGTGFANMASDGKDGGQYMRNRQGNQSFSTRLADLLPRGSVRLSTPVTRIVQTETGGCVVHAASGLASAVFEARRVIVSVPTTHYSSIEFEPSLPAAKQTLASETALGYYSKSVFVFDQPWWREAGLSGVVSSETTDAPIHFTRDTCVEADGQFSITCFHIADTGRAWSKWSAAERRRRAQAHLDRVLGAAARARGIEPLAPIAVIEKEWTKDAWARGAPSPVMMPGTLTSDAGRALRQPFGAVHFVGTETSIVWKGYLEGAVRSGVRGAAEVISILCPRPKAV